MAMGDANRRQLDGAPEEGFPTEPGSGLSVVGRGNLDPEALRSQVGAYRTAMGQGPEAQQEFAANLSSNPEFSREFKDAVFQSADVGLPVIEQDYAGMLIGEGLPSDDDAGAETAGAETAENPPAVIIQESINQNQDFSPARNPDIFEDQSPAAAPGIRKPNQIV